MNRTVTEHDAVAAALSRDVYLDRVPFEMACVAAGLTPDQWHDHAGTQAALVRGRGAAWLVFRGTEATRLRLLDIVANLKVRPKPWAGEGWVHSGYADALERVRYGARKLAERAASDLPLYVTGHSLGGVLATLYGAWVTADTRDGHRIAGVVTFGAPRGASRAALAPIDRATKVRRYAMAGDPAPWWPWPMYAHPCRAVRLASGSRWAGPVSRHSMEGYAAALERLAGVAGRPPAA